MRVKHVRSETVGCMHVARFANGFRLQAKQVVHLAGAETLQIQANDPEADPIRTFSTDEDFVFHRFIHSHQRVLSSRMRLSWCRRNVACLSRRSRRRSGSAGPRREARRAFTESWRENPSPETSGACDACLANSISPGLSRLDCSFARCPLERLQAEA
jgi:hypothetical protein